MSLFNIFLDMLLGMAESFCFSFIFLLDNGGMTCFPGRRSHCGVTRVTFGSSLIKMGVPVVNSRSHRPSLMNQIWLRCGTAGVSDFSNSFVLSGSFLLIIWTFQHEVTLKLHIRYAKDDDFIMGTSPKEQSPSAPNMLFITLSVEFVRAA